MLEKKPGWSCFEVSVLRQHTDQQATAYPLRSGALQGAAAAAAAHTAAPCKITQCSTVSRELLLQSPLIV